ncbi:MAG TPA: response regulator [Myxococcales bacterium]|nr:response regulator [Myxococcales bacterium]
MTLRDNSYALAKWLPSPSWTLLVLAGVGLSVTIWSLSSESERTRRSAAVQNAMVLSESVRTFRGIYTREVVAKLKARGLRVSHEDIPAGSSFALPKALSLEFANGIGSHYLESEADLYSPYPFPWKSGPGLPDDFARKAWSRLSVDPTTPVQEYEERDGRTFLRYATSDLLLESCVECHNTYPGTPRTDWKTGDLRGVLEVTLPLDRQAAVAGGWYSRGVSLFLFLCVLFFAIAGLSVASSLKFGKTARREAERHRATSEELQAAIVERELAEKETRHLEGQIQEAQKLESFNLMVGGLAHDFNNLLLPIVANTDILKEQASAESSSLEMLEEVELAATRASDLCEQMLTYAGKVRGSERTGLDLSRMLDETGRLLTASLAPNCQLKLDLAKDLPLIEADPVQISQVVLNLIKNAAEAIGKDGGEIRLRTGESTADVCPIPCDLCVASVKKGNFESSERACERKTIAGVYLEVSDDGVGMDADTTKKIFDPFFTTKFTGRGLGLAAVQGIVRSHGGSILIDSEVGSHTLIRVTFPAAGELSSRPQPAGAVAISEWQGSGTILLAEDEPAVQAVAKRMLEDMGFHVLAANDGEEALWRFSREPDHFVAFFSDLTMPKMDGLRTLEAIRKIRPSLPAVLCSGYSERIHELATVEDGQTVYIQKPFRSLTLREKLCSLLTASSGSDSADEAAPPHAPTLHLARAKETLDRRKGFAGPAAPGT